MIEYLFIGYLIMNSVFIFYLLFPFLNTITGLFLRERKFLRSNLPQPDIGIIITSYKDLEITRPLISSILSQDYSNFHIYVVADQCEKSEQPFIADSRLTVIFPRVNLDSKVKSILLGLDSFIRPHEYTLIFDPDNLAVPGLLRILSSFLTQGFRAVQGRRAAKNLDTRYACLDALGEHYYNHTQRYVPFLLGSSAPIAGSGMVIETKLYRDILNEIESGNTSQQVIVAEDKMLQNMLVKKGLRIAYSREAVVYDEKIVSGGQLERQRTRWLNSYFKHLRESVSLMISGLAKLDFNIFYFGLVISTPPMVLLLLGGIIFFFANIFVSLFMLMLTLLAGLVFTANFLLVLVVVKAEKEIWDALFGLPVFILTQLLALLKIKKANTDFLVTKKDKIVSIEEVLRERDKQNDRK